MKVHLHESRMVKPEILHWKQCLLFAGTLLPVTKAVSKKGGGDGARVVS
jgi:hypothetical protein